MTVFDRPSAGGKVEFFIFFSRTCLSPRHFFFIFLFISLAFSEVFFLPFRRRRNWSSLGQKWHLRLPLHAERGPRAKVRQQRRSPAAPERATTAKRLSSLSWRSRRASLPCPSTSRRAGPTLRRRRRSERKSLGATKASTPSCWLPRRRGRRVEFWGKREAKSY